MNESKILRKNPKVVSKAKNEELILLNTETADITTLNFVAAFIWSLIDGVRTSDDIIKTVHEKFPNTTIGRVRQDFLKITQELASRDFVLSNTHH